MEKRSNRAGKTTTTAKRARSSKMEASSSVGKTTRSKAAHKTSRSNTSDCK